MKQLLILSVFTALAFSSCATPVKREVKQKRLTKSEKRKLCIQEFMYKFEVQPEVAMELCENIYKREERKEKFPFQGENR